MTQRAIVTGGGQGIGAEIARALAKANYWVGVLDQNVSAAEALVSEIGVGEVLAVDVSDREAVADAIQAFGVIDLLVNNAGIVRFGPLLDQSAEDIASVIGVNLIGTINCAQLAAQTMSTQGGGVIINMSSVNAVHPAPNVGIYAATKAAITSLTQLQALEWGPLGIRVNAVAPGFIDAGMSAPIFLDDKVREKRSGGVPLRRLGTAEDVVQAILFLASDAASYIHGHELVVDGGVIQSVLAHLPRA
ncbi:MAG: SDR family NAD(P)-dependent oxidoreductase [Pseudomonadales bacterium]|jgi:NAD(P)-dependent dehydrogenase (short-subunit alcohol dehydrogenase family)|tara:strand:- start:291 stop:1031 length:741 start_codon:yes stop_codon:yes gene_type:complete